MRVTIKNLVKCFGTQPALRSVSVEITDHELFFLLGPSGCGKTTLLRTIAGFYQPDEGDVYFGEKLMNGVPPHQRNTGMVFQNYALWPHMTVAENVAYGLEARSVDAVEKKNRVREALEIVRMETYAERTPNQLSGGQQQRVALARALVIRPDVLLLDEPLSNLDARLRLEMREEIRRIHQETQITTLYVTHDQKESLSLAGRMAVMRDGQIEQLGTPREVYRSPANRFVADFIGETNWIEGTMGSQGSDGTRVLKTSAGEFKTTHCNGHREGTEIWVGFRPEAVTIGSFPTNRIATTIEQVNYLGEIEQYELNAGGGWRIKAFEQNPATERKSGQLLEVFIRPQDLFVLERTGSQRANKQ